MLSRERLRLESAVSGTGSRGGSGAPLAELAASSGDRSRGLPSVSHPPLRSGVDVSVTSADSDAVGPGERLTAGESVVAVL